MLISVITPNFNSAAHIKETYQSLCNQTYSNWEWLITDDGSTDNSPELIQKWAEEEPRIKFRTRVHQPKGASACRNIGVDYAKGHYLLFLDADDIFAPFCLKQRIEYMQQNPALDFAVFKMGYFHREVEDTTGIVNRFNNDNDQYLKDFISYNIPWQTSCPMWKREFLIKNKIRFSEKYQRLQDPEFHTKILLLHNPIFKALEDSDIDCFYRQSTPNVKSKSRIDSVKKTTDSILLYYQEINELVKINNHDYDNYLDIFNINIFHSLLFYVKLPTITLMVDLYKKMNTVRPINNLKLTNVRLFAFFNYIGVTFIKGAGVSRLWKVINR